MTDERKGRPSASSMERYFNCRGAFLLEQQVPAEERFSSKDADRGTRIHEANESGNVAGLELKEQDLVVLTRQIEERIFNQWCEDFKIDDAEIIRERRWWLSKGEKSMVSCQLDFVALSEKKKMALVLDLKSGRKAVAPAPSNWQLRTGAVILTANYNLVGVRVGIIAPLQKTQPLGEYDSAALFKAWDQIDTLMEDLENPKSKRVAGSHCEFCPAKHICPEARKSVEVIAELKGLKWSVLTAADKLKLFVQCKDAEKIIKGVLDNIKAEMTKDPTCIPGLTKKRDTFPREVTDSQGVYNALLKDFGQVLNTEERLKFTADFTALCGISVGDLEAFVRELTGKSAEEATAWVNSACAGYIKTGQRSGSIEIEKPKKV